MSQKTAFASLIRGWTEVEPFSPGSVLRNDVVANDPVAVVQAPAVIVKSKTIEGTGRDVAGDRIVLNHAIAEPQSSAKVIRNPVALNQTVAVADPGGIAGDLVVLDHAVAVAKTIADVAGDDVVFDPRQRARRIRAAQNSASLGPFLLRAVLDRQARQHACVRLGPGETRTFEERVDFQAVIDRGATPGRYFLVAVIDVDDRPLRVMLDELEVTR